MKNPGIALVLALLVPRSALAADVLTVGPGQQYPTLQAAVDAAADGDILLVRSTKHAATTIRSKALTLVADTGIGVDVQGGLLVELLGPDQTVVLGRINASGVGAKQPGLRIRQCQGPVRIQGGTFRGDHGYNPYPPPPDLHPDGWPGVWISNCATVSLSGATCVGGAGGEVEDWWKEYPTGDGAAGVFVRSTQVALYGCDLDGGDGGSCYDVANLDGGQGGAGLFCAQGFAFVAGTTAKGGSGGNGGDAGGFGGGGCGGRGGDGVRIEGASAAGQFLDDAFSGGPGGYAGFYASYCTGQAPSGLPVLPLAGATSATLSGAARGFAIETPVRESIAPLLTFTGRPGDKAWVEVGHETQFQYLFSSKGVSLTEGSGFTTALPVGVLGPSGNLHVPWHVVRDLGPGVLGSLLHVQGRIVDAAGQTFLADHQALVLLDASL